MEVDINDDPMVYEGRPIFAKWTRRQAVVGGGLIVLTLGVVAASWALGLDPITTGGACALAGIPVGAFGLGRRHGLLPERWVPLVRAERRAPRELVWKPPKATFARDGRARRTWRARGRREVELEEDDLLGAFLDEGDDTEATTRQGVMSWDG